MKWNPLVLFGEKNPDKAESMYKMLVLLLQLEAASYREVRIQEGIFGWEIMVINSED